MIKELGILTGLILGIFVVGILGNFLSHDVIILAFGILFGVVVTLVSFTIFHLSDYKQPPELKKEPREESKSEPSEVSLIESPSYKKIQIIGEYDPEE